MIFLIEYDRRLGKVVTFREFHESRRGDAANARLELELCRNKEALDREIVLLEAASEAALRQTHRRYFETATQTKDRILTR